MGLEMKILIAAIMGITGAAVAFWTGWRARDLQGPPKGSYGLPRGYRSINYPDPSPGRRPINPYNGERIPNPPPREP
jgi:hypothetical protein